MAVIHYTILLYKHFSTVSQLSREQHANVLEDTKQHSWHAVNIYFKLIQRTEHDVMKYLTFLDPKQ